MRESIKNLSCEQEKEVSGEKKVEVYLMNSSLWLRAGNCGREH